MKNVYLGQPLLAHKSFVPLLAPHLWKIEKFVTSGSRDIHAIQHFAIKIKISENAIPLQFACEFDFSLKKRSIHLKLNIPNANRW